MYRANSRRHFISQLALCAGAAAVSHAQAAPRRSRRKPNIVIILADDVGYGDLGCYGATHVSTPNIDSLAKGGLRFTNAHSDAATCTPSRYALLTGRYAWRIDGSGVLPGDAKSLIEPGRPTLGSVFKQGGYSTGLVGKWHVGLGDGHIDWNGDIHPGPNEAGFDEAFFFPATADRVPTVFIHNHRVVGLDPSDPIAVSYDKKIGDEPTGSERPDLLKMKLTAGHDGTIVDGISRIGFMTGGHTARWKDEEIAQTLTAKACEFIDAHKAGPFLLYFAPSDIHVPRSPASSFVNTTGCGVRCDAIDQLDWSVGRVLETIRRNGLDHDTIVVFTSDNGPVVNDGYDDGSDQKLNGHKPAGPFRGGKNYIYEGGTREPFLFRWPRRVHPGVSPALIGQYDLVRSLAAITGIAMPPTGAEDSEDVSAALLGASAHGRDFLVEEAQMLAICTERWKLIDRSEHPGPSSRHKIQMPPLTGQTGLQRQNLETRQMPWSANFPRNAPAPLELYDLMNDPAESINVASEHPETVAQLQKKLQTLRMQTHRP